MFLDFRHGLLAVDSVGNLFIAEQSANRIRKVDAVSGTITTYAGTGGSGYSGDGSAATAARLNAPTGLATDSNGNLFIADSANNVIRRVAVSTKVISTIAGNGTALFSGDGSAATSASLSGALGVAVDSSGNVFIADTGNNRVRKVTASTGIISTVAGNGTTTDSGNGGPATSAGLAAPGYLTADASGNLYLAGSARVREISTSGTITTIAGQGVYSFSGEGGPAVNATFNGCNGLAIDGSGNLLCASANSRILKVDGITSNLVTAAGSVGWIHSDPSFKFGWSAQASAILLGTPSDIAVDTSGNVFFVVGGGQGFSEGLFKFSPATHCCPRRS